MGAPEYANAPLIMIMIYNGKISPNGPEETTQAEQHKEMESGIGPIGIGWGWGRESGRCGFSQKWEMGKYLCPGSLFQYRIVHLEEETEKERGGKEECK